MQYQWVKRFAHQDDGQDLVEYGLLISTVAVAVLIGTSAFGSAIEAWFTALMDLVTTTGV